MSELLILFAIVAVLVLLNGLFVAAEFAIVGAPRASIQRRAGAGNRVAQMVWNILEHPDRQDRFIATAQLGITVASLGLGMYGEHTLAEWLAEHFHTWGVEAWLDQVGLSRFVAAHALASLAAIAVLTYLHIVVGEMVPKSLALQFAERSVLWITPPMLFLQKLAYPFVLLLNGIGVLFLRVVGVNRQASHQHYHTPEELEYIIEESQESGLLLAESGQILHELFDFSQLDAEDVMVPRVQIVGVPLGADREAIIDVVRRAPHTRYPVYEGDFDHIVGVVHMKDLLRRLLDGGAIGRDDAREVPYVPETALLEDVLAAMQRTRAQMVVVMDEHGGTAGIVTVSDLFEEVIGDIQEPDEHPEMATDDEGRLIVAGTVRVEEVGEALGVVTEHADIDTVSGLVLSLLGRPPEVGDEVTFEEVCLRVLEVEGNGVAQALATLTEPPGEEPTDGESPADEVL